MANILIINADSNLKRLIKLALPGMEHFVQYSATLHNVSAQPPASKLDLVIARLVADDDQGPEDLVDLRKAFPSARIVVTAATNPPWKERSFSVWSASCKSSIVCWSRSRRGLCCTRSNRHWVFLDATKNGPFAEVLAYDEQECSSLLQGRISPPGTDHTGSPAHGATKTLVSNPSPHSTSPDGWRTTETPLKFRFAKAPEAWYERRYRGWEF